MNLQIELKMAESHMGRIVLHILALRQDHKCRWHFAGVRRELSDICRNRLGVRAIRVRAEKVHGCCDGAQNRQGAEFVAHQQSEVRNLSRRTGHA